MGVIIEMKVNSEGTLSAQVETIEIPTAMQEALR
jgi:hypothetical protein